MFFFSRHIYVKVILNCRNDRHETMLYLTEASFDMFMAQAHKNVHHTQSHDICSYPFRDEITADDQIILCNTSISRENREKPACVKEKEGSVYATTPDILQISLFLDYCICIMNSINIAINNQNFHFWAVYSGGHSLPERLFDKPSNKGQISNIVSGWDTPTQHSVHFLKNLLLYFGMSCQKVCAPRQCERGLQRVRE